MTMDEKIQRINELYHKSQAGPLSDDEKEEQVLLRKEYIEAIRKNIRVQMDAVDVVNEDGTVENLGERRRKKEST